MKAEYNRELVQKRLKELLEESGLKSQGEFGRKILEIPDNNKDGYPDRYTSDLFVGTKKKLSRKKAKVIKKHFPSYRIEWMLGEDDFKTETQKMISDFSQFATEIEFRGFALRVFAELSGYNIFLPKSDDAESMVENVKKGYVIQQGTKELGHLSLEQFNLLSQDIQELTKQRIESFIRFQEVK